MQIIHIKCRLSILWIRLNTTNSTKPVAYETGLNSLLAVVDSYQVSTLFDCVLTSKDHILTFLTWQVEVLKVDLTEEKSGGQRVSLTVAGLPRLDSPPTCFYRWLGCTYNYTTPSYQESEHLRGESNARLQDGGGWLRP